MNAVDEKRTQRFQFLNLVYEKTHGNEYEWVNMWDIGKELGWDRHTTDVVSQYLVGEGLIKFWALGGVLGITHDGVREIEHARSNPQEATTYFPAVINIMSGDFRGSILNVESTLSNISQTIGTRSGLSDSDREEIQHLVKQLNESLESAPHDKIQEAEAVAWAADSLLKYATEEKPNRVKVEITKDGLMKAASNMAAVAPVVLSIAERIISTIDRLVSR